MKHEYVNDGTIARLALGSTDEPDTIVWIATPGHRRNQGQAKNLLQTIVSDADKEERTLNVSLMQADPGISRDRLRNLFGYAEFVDTQDPFVMVREPKGAAKKKKGKS